MKHLSLSLMISALISSFAMATPVDDAINKTGRLESDIARDAAVIRKSLWNCWGWSPGTGWRTYLPAAVITVN